MRIIFFSLISLLAGPAFAQTPACGAPGMVDKIAIEHALGMDVPQTVTIVKVCETYAKATVAKLDSGENQTAYLNKTNGKWTVIAQGATVDPSKLNIPEAAW